MRTHILPVFFAIAFAVYASGATAQPADLGPEQLQQIMDESVACSRAIQEVARLRRQLPYANLFTDPATNVLAAITNGLPNGVYIWDLHLTTTMEGPQPADQHPRTRARIEADAFTAEGLSAYVTALEAEPTFSAVRRMPSNRAPADSRLHAAASLEIGVAPRASASASRASDSSAEVEFSTRLLETNIILQRLASESPSPQRQQLANELREWVHTARVHFEKAAAESSRRIASFESSFWAEGIDQLQRRVEGIGTGGQVRQLVVKAEPLSYPGPHLVQLVTMSFDGDFKTVYETLLTLERLRGFAQFREIRMEQVYPREKTHATIAMIVLCRAPRSGATPSTQPTGR